MGTKRAGLSIPEEMAAMATTRAIGIMTQVNVPMPSSMQIV
jgi:hypothetical protein